MKMWLEAEGKEVKDLISNLSFKNAVEDGDFDVPKSVLLKRKRIRKVKHSKHHMWSPKSVRYVRRCVAKNVNGKDVKHIRRMLRKKEGFLRTRASVWAKVFEQKRIMHGGE